MFKIWYPIIRFIKLFQLTNLIVIIHEIHFEYYLDNIHCILQFQYKVSSKFNTCILLYRLQHLNNLLENYLEPLKRETFLSNAEINALFGNIQEIVSFQRQFLENLDEAIDMEPDFHQFEHSSQYKVCISV